jgi:ribonuclease HII
MLFPKTPRDLYQIENAVREKGYLNIVGLDEAGRGPLAGPVVAAGVSLPQGMKITNLNDSKKVSAVNREKLYNILLNIPKIKIGLAIVSPEDIDRINILKATHLAMKQAIENMGIIPDIILVDGRPVPGLPVKSLNIIKGDAKCACIAAASIIAKVSRDRMMVEFDSQFPGYGFKNHKGYGTKEHLESLNRLGPCSIHRKSFSPVANKLYSLF